MYLIPIWSSSWFGQPNRWDRPRTRYLFPRQCCCGEHRKNNNNKNLRVRLCRCVCVWVCRYERALVSMCVCVCVCREKYIDPNGGSHFVTTLAHTRAFPNTHLRRRRRRRWKRFSGGGELEKLLCRNAFRFPAHHKARHI